jgi:hypothetical protein
MRVMLIVGLAIPVTLVVDTALAHHGSFEYDLNVDKRIVGPGPTRPGWSVTEYIAYLIGSTVNDYCAGRPPGDWQEHDGKAPCQ